MITRQVEGMVGPVVAEAESLGDLHMGAPAAAGSERSGDAAAGSERSGDAAAGSESSEDAAACTR